MQQPVDDRPCFQKLRLWSGLLLILLPLGGCSPETSAFSGTTNWLRCHDTIDCVGHAGAVCVREGYCVDPEGQRIYEDEPLEQKQAVVLTAVVSPGEGIAAEWTNGTDEPIFLRGCVTADGWYLENGEWIAYGPFAQCAVETEVVQVAPGETYLDTALTPPERGENVWRLEGTYGVECTSGQILSQAECTQVFKLFSDNEVSP